MMIRISVQFPLPQIAGIRLGTTVGDADGTTETGTMAAGQMAVGIEAIGPTDIAPDITAEEAVITKSCNVQF